MKKIMLAVASLLLLVGCAGSTPPEEGDGTAESTPAQMVSIKKEIKTRCDSGLGELHIVKVTFEQSDLDNEVYRYEWSHPDFQGENFGYAEWDPYGKKLISCDWDIMDDPS